VIYHRSKIATIGTLPGHQRNRAVVKARPLGQVLYSCDDRTIGRRELLSISLFDYLCRREVRPCKLGIAG
jgi:hypothetical protein